VPAVRNFEATASTSSPDGSVCLPTDTCPPSAVRMIQRFSPRTAHLTWRPLPFDVVIPRLEVFQKSRTPRQDDVSRQPCGTAKRAFPYHKHPPAGRRKSIVGALVPVAVAVDLCLPEFRTRSRQPEHRTIVSVPEAAVHEDRRVPGREHEVRPAREITAVQTEAVSARM
jgi:hypothetical protein